MKTTHFPVTHPQRSGRHRIFGLSRRLVHPQSMTTASICMRLTFKAVLMSFINLTRSSVFDLVSCDAI
jgi:hypothetical protein